MEPRPPLPLYQRGENGAFLPFARLHLILGEWRGGVGWGFAVPFFFFPTEIVVLVLSKVNRTQYKSL